MTMQPRIFVSTVSSELRTIRQLTANVLQRLGYDPVWQDIFGMEPGELKRMLREKIDDCEGLIQIVGRAYGSEPPEPDPEFGRVSYTQYELLYARKTGKTTWILFAEDGCTRDRPLEELDLPGDEHQGDPRAYQAEHRALQEAWRERLRRDGHLRHGANNDTELELKLEKLKDDFARLRRGFRTWQKLVAGLGIAAVLLIGYLIAAQRGGNERIKAVSRQIETVQANQALSLDRIRSHLREASEQALQKDLAAADSLPGFDDREKAREQAQQAHETRLRRIDDLAASFVALNRQAESSPVLREMIRILREEKTNAVDKAITYAERQRPTVLERVRARKRAEQEQNRSELEPLLNAASLEQTRGKPDQARAHFQELLELEPTWPAALERYAYFLQDQSYTALVRGELPAALDDAQSAFELASRLEKQEKSSPESQRVLAGAHNLFGDVLRDRAGPGDAEQALRHYTRSLELVQALSERDPSSAPMARAVSVAHENIAGILTQRGQPGDADQALEHYTRALEISEELARRDPGSAGLATDLSVSQARLGRFLARRGQPGDGARALDLMTRSVKTLDDLQRRNAGSAEAEAGTARKLSAGLLELGDFLATRGAPGDADQALKSYTRSLQIREDLRKREPKSAQAAEDLAIILNTLGAFLARRDQQGDAEQALEYHKRSLAVLEESLRRNPDSGETARAVTISLEGLGDFFARRHGPHDAEEALKYYERGLQIGEELRQRNPNSARAARDVSVSLEKLGTLLADRGQPGDAERAIDSFTRSLELREDLYRKNEGSAGAARDLMVALNWLGGLLAERGAPGDAEQALKHYTRSLEMGEELLKRNPESGQAARDVAVSLSRLGSLLAERGKPGDMEQALAHFSRGLAMSEDILRRDPSARTFRDVLVGHKNLAGASLYLHRTDAALAHLESARTVLDRMIAAGMAGATAARDRAELEGRILSVRAQSAAEAKQVEEVASAGARLRALEPKLPVNLYNAACAYGVAAGLAVQQKSEPEKADQAARQKYINLSLATLKEAIAAGYNNFHQMKEDSDLVPLRGLPEFESLFPGARGSANARSGPAR